MNLGQKTMGVCFGRYVNLQILETDYDCFCGCATYCVDLRYYTLLACFFNMHTTQMASFSVKKFMFVICLAMFVYYYFLIFIQH
jgi:hypothetical protein